ncbi:hypothetical protein IFO70_18965 [Phormidium tenue FACHB-886]|nr:hypothetical protein [Phormidium tenue FACHB-886]
MSIALGQRFNYLLFPGMFSILAIAVLTLAAAALGIAAMALLRHQGRDYRLWLAAGLAAYLLVVYLSDE